MTIEDKLLMLDVFFDVRVTLAPDGEHIEIRGAPAAAAFAEPRLVQLKPEIIAHLRTNPSPARAR